MANTKVTSAVIADNAVGIDQLNVSDGTNGQVLTTNGSGTLSFSTISGYTDSDVESYLNTSAIYTDATNDRLGIGTSSPAALTHIKTSAAANTETIRLENDNAAGYYNYIGFKNVGLTNPVTRIYGGRQGADGSGDFLVQLTNSSGTLQNVIQCFNGVAATYTALSTSGNERMRITSGGSILFGKTSASASATGIHINNNGVQISVVDFTSAGTAKVFNNNNATGSTYKIEYRQNNSAVGNISVGSSSTSYNTTSDYRLKENVDYNFNALERVAQLKPARFNFIADADTTVDGFLAHEVSDIVPEAIQGIKDEMQEEEYEVTPAVLDEDGNVVTEAVMGTREVPKYQGIDQSKLVPLLTKAIQEQQTIIDDLKARIETLENA